MCVSYNQGPVVNTHGTVVLYKCLGKKKIRLKRS